MRVPTRRGEIERREMAEPEDHLLTPAKIQRLKDELKDLVDRQRPEMIQEVRRLAEMGDFSENAGYQIAKGSLRRINDRIETLKERIKTAVPIEHGSKDGMIRVGSTVTVESGTKPLTFEIVGSMKTNPSRGRISHRSPLGMLLLGHVAGDEVILKTAEREVLYRVIEVR